MTELDPAAPIVAPPGSPDFLVHNEGDHVAVAVHDVAVGPRVAVYMDSDREVAIEAAEAVPLGHKIALQELVGEAEVIEYGVVVGLTRMAVAKGRMVHVHNLRSARWEASR